MSYLRIRLHLKTDKPFGLSETVLLRIILHGVDKKLTQKKMSQNLYRKALFYSGTFWTVPS